MVYNFKLSGCTKEKKQNKKNFTVKKPDYYNSKY